MLSTRRSLVNRRCGALNHGAKDRVTQAADRSGPLSILRSDRCIIELAIQASAEPCRDRLADAVAIDMHDTKCAGVSMRAPHSVKLVREGRGPRRRVRKSCR